MCFVGPSKLIVSSWARPCQSPPAIASLFLARQCVALRNSLALVQDSRLRSISNCSNKAIAAIFSDVLQLAVCSTIKV